MRTLIVGLVWQVGGHECWFSINDLFISIKAALARLLRILLPPGLSLIKSFSYEKRESYEAKFRGPGGGSRVRHRGALLRNLRRWKRVRCGAARGLISRIWMFANKASPRRKKITAWVEQTILYLYRDVLLLFALRSTDRRVGATSVYWWRTQRSGMLRGVGQEGLMRSLKALVAMGTDQRNFAGCSFALRRSKARR